MRNKWFRRPGSVSFDGLSVPARRVLGGHNTFRRRVGWAWLWLTGMTVLGPWWSSLGWNDCYLWVGYGWGVWLGCAWPCLALASCVWWASLLAAVGAGAASSSSMALVVVGVVIVTADRFPAALTSTNLMVPRI